MEASPPRPTCSSSSLFVGSRGGCFSHQTHPSTADRICRLHAMRYDDRSPRVNRKAATAWHRRHPWSFLDDLYRRKERSPPEYAVKVVDPPAPGGSGVPRNYSSSTHRHLAGAFYPDRQGTRIAAFFLAANCSQPLPPLSAIAWCRTDAYRLVHRRRRPAPCPESWIAMRLRPLCRPARPGNGS